MGTNNDPCDDCIRRQAVLDVIDAEAWAFCDYLIRENRNDEQKPVAHFSDNLRDRIKDDLPPVTPQRQKGKWILDESGCITICNWCGQGEWHGYIPTPDEATKWMPICPKCGAEMGVEENGKDTTHD